MPEGHTRKTILEEENNKNHHIGMVSLGCSAYSLGGLMHSVWTADRKQKGACRAKGWRVARKGSTTPGLSSNLYLTAHFHVQHSSQFSSPLLQFQVSVASHLRYQCSFFGLSPLMHFLVPYLAHQGQDDLPKITFQTAIR